MNEKIPEMINEAEMRYAISLGGKFAPVGPAMRSGGETAIRRDISGVHMKIDAVTYFHPS